MTIIDQRLVFATAARFIGVSEVPGSEDNPAILAMLRLDQDWPKGDETPWCSAFANYIAWLFRLPRSKSLRARSWLTVGVPTGEPQIGDIVVLNRGNGPQDPRVIDAPGHVGFFAGYDTQDSRIYVLGGNQGDAVTVAPFKMKRVLGYRDIVSVR